VTAIGGVVLDASALLAFASGRPYPAAVVWHALEQGVVLVVPTAALADAQARLSPGDLAVLDVLLDLPVTVVDDLTRAQAAHVAALLAKASRPDLLPAAHAATVARRRGVRLLTTDAGPVRTLAPDVDVDEIP
jgi:predicted nucleic acid-binding protein